MRPIGTAGPRTARQSPILGHSRWPKIYVELIRNIIYIVKKFSIKKYIKNVGTSRLPEVP
jgi:hypothetical protein